MSTLEKVRDLLHSKKVNAAGQGQQKFLPEGSLGQIFGEIDLSDILFNQSFGLDHHKIDDIVEVVSAEGKTLFAILVDTKLEHALFRFIEYGILDRNLPVVEETTLKPVLNPYERDEFMQRQWEYFAHKFSKRLYSQRLSKKHILPYIDQTKIGGGSFSTVYDVFVHPAHQNIDTQVQGMGLHLVRKEITHVDSKYGPEDESELLFLLGSLKHRNIVELVAAYVLDDVYNLIFSPADMNLAEVLLQSTRPASLEENTSIFKAIQGLASGLRHLHFFEFRGVRAPETLTLLCGTHQDIKPKNILVRGADFILADFGLSRLKPIDMSSQTTWKDATYEYGAPECRDRNTWVQGQIYRASDIWSLGCVISELLVYMERGSQGVQSYRDCRLMEDHYGVTRAFHDGTRLQDRVLDSLLGVEKESDSIAISSLLSLLRDMFAGHPKDRPNAKEVESFLERIVFQVLIQDLLNAVTKSYTGTSVFRTSLRLEENRIRAWAGTLGLITLPGQSTTTNTPQSIGSFTESCEAFETAILRLKTPTPFQSIERNEEFLISTLRQLNNTICDRLPETMRISADRLFAILSTATSDLKSLLSIRKATLQEASEYKDIVSIASMRYMSILYTRRSEEIALGPRIERAMIEEDVRPNDFRARPPMYWWYNGEYLSSQRQQVLVEWIDYDQKLPPNVRSEKFRAQLQSMYRRVRGLVRMLRSQPRASDFRILDCVGTFHDHEDQKFGIVYSFPGTQATPVRLHYLLKGGSSKRPHPPHIGQRLALAKVLAACVQVVHVSGWTHKYINSYNILFFHSEDRLSDGDYRQPYLVGFQHSREDEQDADTWGGVFSDETRQYQHPCYREGSIPFRREFDYYSLGLVLVEIGVWECLGNVYNHPKHLESGASELRDEYLKICNNQILERMGPTYHEVTKTCLEAADAESVFNGKELDTTLKFQRDVVDKLESCRF